MDRGKPCVFCRDGDLAGSGPSLPVFEVQSQFPEAGLRCSVLGTVPVSRGFLKVNLKPGQGALSAYQPCTPLFRSLPPVGEDRPSNVRKGPTAEDPGSAGLGEETCPATQHCVMDGPQRGWHTASPAGGPWGSGRPGRRARCESCVHCTSARPAGRLRRPESVRFPPVHTFSVS